MKNNMKETIKNIRNGLEATYGFAPAMNKIKPLETDEINGIIYWMAFSVGGKGYMWSYGVVAVDRAPEYDCARRTKL